MRPIVAGLAAAAMACGSGSKPGATFDGVVHGQPMKPADAISSPAKVPLAAISAHVVAIVLTDVSGACAKVSANVEPKNGKALIILLADVSPTLEVTTPTGPGTFTIYNSTTGGLPPAHAALATYRVNDENCNQIASESAIATSGAVKLTSISGGSYTGTYTIGFDTGEQVTGEFHTADCPGLSTYITSSSPSCG
jgi:5-hydroxyisourate hydrolase-like protein (transthyretin family)